MSHEALPPHPDLKQYYSHPKAKRGFLRDIFDDTAPDYDRIESVLALGSGSWYRRRALARAGLREGMRVLDVAVGTGLVAREAIAIVGRRGSVTGVDPSIGMVTQARASLDLPIVLGVGEQLPFADQSFEFLSMGYALRHLADLRPAFAEFRRVLKPGGIVCVLEIVRPVGKIQRKALEIYFKGLFPIISRLVSKRPQSGKLWTYYWETIDQCVPPTTVLRAMSDAGLIHARRFAELGIFAEYTSVRPSA